MAEEDTVRKRRRWPWILAGALVASVVALVLLVPVIVVSIRYPTLTVDLAPYLKDAPDGLVSNKTVSVNLDISRGAEGRYVVHATGHVLDWPFTAWVNVLPSFRFVGVDIAGDASFRLDGTKLQLLADFTASSSGDWCADVSMDKTEICESDPLISQLLSRLQMPAISNLVFSGSVDLSAKAERTAKTPVPQWNASCRLADMNIACDANGKPLAVKNLRMKLGALGIADHRDIRPIFPMADSITVAGFTLSNAYARLQTSERTILVTNNVSRARDTAGDSSAVPSTTNVVKRSFLVTEAGAKCCNGDLKIYSLFLNDDRLNVTLFVDGIDAGAALKHVNGFHGEASGRLYGKIPLRYRKDEHRFHLENIYLYSVPGEIGNLRLYDPKPVVDNLAMGGVPQETCANLSKALTDLAYDVLKVSLHPEPNGGLALSLKIAGKSTHNNVTVPVNLEVTFHGDLEQLLNTGFRTFNR